MQDLGHDTSSALPQVFKDEPHMTCERCARTQHHGEHDCAWENAGGGRPPTECWNCKATKEDRMAKLHEPRGLAGFLMEEDMREFTKFMKWQQEQANM